jgi:hypothetical protein
MPGYPLQSPWKIPVLIPDSTQPEEGICCNNFCRRGDVRFCWGFLAKTGVFLWCFGGENVVHCVVDVVF